MRGLLAAELDRRNKAITWMALQSERRKDAMFVCGIAIGRDIGTLVSSGAAGTAPTTGTGLDGVERRTFTISGDSDRPRADVVGSAIAEALRNALIKHAADVQTPEEDYAPGIVVIYRDGASDEDSGSVASAEVQHVQAMFRRINPDYDPILVYVVCYKGADDDLDAGGEDGGGGGGGGGGARPAGIRGDLDVFPHLVRPRGGHVPGTLDLFAVASHTRGWDEERRAVLVRRKRSGTNGTPVETTEALLLPVLSASGHGALARLMAHHCRCSSCGSAGESRAPEVLVHAQALLRWETAGGHRR